MVMGVWRARQRFAAWAMAMAMGLGVVALAGADSGTSAAASAPAWKPRVTPQGLVFPSLLIATATMRRADIDADSGVLGDPNGVIGATVTATRDRQRVKLRVRMPTLARESTLEAVLPRKGGRYELYPTMLWDFDKLRAQHAARPDSIEFALEVDGRKAGSAVERVRVQSINVAPYYVDGAGGTADLNWMFAAYVNEDHPLVQQILGEALASGIVDAFDGYQSGDPEQVYRQVFAIWHVLKRRGIRYSSIARTSAASDAVLSQHVRFLDESWRNSQANCVDGSVLLASILRKIDINPSLVLVPGHMLLGFDLDPRGEDRAYVETTLLGRDAGMSSPTLAGLDRGRRGIGERESMASFETAVARGLATVRKAGSRFNREDEPEYQIIDIEAARRMGVTPIAAR